MQKSLVSLMIFNVYLHYHHASHIIFIICNTQETQVEYSVNMQKQSLFFMYELVQVYGKVIL